MCVIDEHLYLDDIDSLVNTAQAAYRADAAYNVKNRQYLLWRGDHKDAYRQFPISPTDHSVASIRLPVPREKRGPTWPHSSGYYVHLRLPFGARGSMLHYSRRVNRVLGFQIKEEKTMLPAVEGKLLGIKLTISPSAITMDVDEQRRQKLQEQLRVVRQNKRLSPTLAGKLAGKLGFAGTAFWGKNGRAFLRALYNRAARGRYQSGFDEKHEIARALDWFQWALVHCPRRRIPLGQQQQASAIYTDAEFSVNQQGAMTGRIGSVILLPNNATRFVSWQVPTELFTKLEPRETQITPLEVLAVPFSLHHWLADKKALGEAHKNPEGIIVTVYIDSTAAQFCIRKGSSRQDDMNALAAETWKMSAANNITLWTEHVSSEENGADLPSRNMITACEAMGWQASPVQYDVPWRKWLAAVEAPIEGLQEGH
ncbi:hypothetical protein FOZ63_024630 [Perkinsus olseni]|uniref:Uncharacterized protein n=1 Tax=Perkinsus olseni TaxID=32597 RepID=A0A7J6TWA2_PEROL|nr:hypothetical protein FOZ63_024630 [Perkinsus olseni]